MRELGWSTWRVAPQGGHRMWLTIAAGLHLGGDDSYPDVFELFGEFADGMKVEDGYVRCRIFPVSALNRNPTFKRS